MGKWNVHSQIARSKHDLELSDVIHIQIRFLEDELPSELNRDVIQKIF